MDEPRQEVEATAQRYSLIPTTQQRFIEQWSAAYASAGETLRVIWLQLRDEWLRVKEGKSGSPHTRRAYEEATVAWFQHLSSQRHADGRTVQPWEATTAHVRLWQQHLLIERGLAPSTVNQRLAACSSFYTFVINERGMTAQGVEVTAFMDVTMRTRANPFAGVNVQRMRTRQYGKARVLSAEETDRLLNHLAELQHTVIGARNYALVLTYLLTGYRNAEAVNMRWGGIRPNKNQPGLVYEWRGKGGKRQPDALPQRVYQAIVHYLKTARRWDGIQPEEYIFRPIAVNGLKNLRHVGGKPLVENRPLSAKAVQQMLLQALRKAGVARPEEVRVHDLRHTFAHVFRGRQTLVMEALRARLHHESLYSAMLER
jgi:integrase